MFAVCKDLWYLGKMQSKTVSIKLFKLSRSQTKHTDDWYEGE